MTKVLKNPRYKSKVIVYYSSTEYDKRANSAFLIAAYAVLILGQNIDSVWQKFTSLRVQPRPFRDASQTSKCPYQCTILDCLYALQKALELQLFDIQRFDCQQYDYLEKLDNGDISAIIPNKLFAFSSPQANSVDEQGFNCFTPADYVPLFKKLNIGTVIRLNKNNYDRTIFSRSRIKHYDLYFKDGSLPSQEIIQEFIRIVQEEPKGVAVHCKAGLGRTGTLIGCYMISNYQMTAREYIAWSRLSRPGSVIGQQQDFLLAYEKQIVELLEAPTIDLQSIAEQRDKGQGLRLLKSKSFYQSQLSNSSSLLEKSVQEMSYVKRPIKTRLVRRRFKTINLFNKN